MTADSVAADGTPDLSHISPRDKAEILAQALPYIRKFHGKTIVIKYGGKIGRASCRERVYGLV